MTTYALAHAIGGLDEDVLRPLEDARFALEQHREDGMTPKNLALIRLVLTDGVWSRVADLPEQLMQQARLKRRHAPVRAAVLAQNAVAVAILSVAPVRLGNLASIRLGENLIKPGGPYSIYWLTFRKYDVKNQTALQLKLDEMVTGIIDEYVHGWAPPGPTSSSTSCVVSSDKSQSRKPNAFASCISTIRRVISSDSYEMRWSSNKAHSGKSASANCAATRSSPDCAATPARISPLRKGEAFASSVARFEKL